MSPFSLHHCAALVEDTYRNRVCVKHYCPTLLCVLLVADKNKGEILVISSLGVAEKLRLPLVEREEAVQIRDVVNKETAVGALVEKVLKTLVALLAGGVPNLQTQPLSLYGLVAGHKVHPHRRRILLAIVIVDVARKGLRTEVTAR